MTGVNDAYAVDEGATLNEAAPGVLGNDLTLVSSVGTVTAALVSDVSNGDLTLAANGSFTYTHDGSETTNDSFTYRPVQGAFSGTVATVSITVNPIDDDPLAAPDGPYNVSNASLLSVAAPGVLENDVDPEGLGLTAVLVSDVVNGDLTLNPNGSFTYLHDGTETLSDSFTYQAQDPGGNLSTVVTVTINVGPINPDPPTVTIEGPSFGAPGIEGTYTASIVDGSGPRSYDWSITRSGVEVAQGTNTSLPFTPTLTGLHIVSLTVSDDAGSDTDSFDLMVLSDVAGSTFVADIVWLAEEGITRGCNPPTNDQFCPDNVVTRGQMAAFLVRFLGLTAVDSSISFVDTGGSVFEDDILKLATAGITRGCNADGTAFCPNASVTRGQMAAFLVRAFGLTADGGGDLFVDDDSSIFEADIDKLATAGITRGCNPPTNNRFCPADVVTRGQMAAFLNRADDL